MSKQEGWRFRLFNFWWGHCRPNNENFQAVHQKCGEVIAPSLETFLSNDILVFSELTFYRNPFKVFFYSMKDGRVWITFRPRGPLQYCENMERGCSDECFWRFTVRIAAWRDWLNILQNKWNWHYHVWRFFPFRNLCRHTCLLCSAQKFGTTT